MPGQALEPPPGEEARELRGHHCRAAFFAAGLGRVPVDAYCACTYGKHGLFGDLELNHVARSTGRDIRLAPAPAGEPLQFFAGPYAEAGGRPHRTVQRRLRHAQLCGGALNRRPGTSSSPGSRAGSGGRGAAAPSNCSR